MCKHDAISPETYFEPDDCEQICSCPVCHDEFVLKSGSIYPWLSADGDGSESIQFICFCCPTCLLRAADPEFCKMGEA